MPTETTEIESLANREYDAGFITDVEADSAPMGLNEDIIRFISKKKEERDEVLATFEKLGVPVHERAALLGEDAPTVAVDAVFDSVSVKTTFQKTLADKGIIFCAFSEAVKNHPELVRKYLGSVVPYS